MSFSAQAPYRALDGSYTTVAAKLTSLEAGAGTGGFTFVRKLADETVTSSTALQDDNELFFPIAANETWEFDANLLLSGATAGDASLTWSVPSGATGEWGGAVLADTATSVTGDVVLFQRNDFSDAGFVNAGTPGTTVPYALASLNGVVVNGATAGNVRLRWAQRASSGTATTVRAGSRITATRVSPVQPVGASFGAMQLVQRQVLATAATSIDFTGLDLNADEMYIGVYSIKNATAAAQDIALQYNGDTTAANYRRQYISGQSSTSAAGNTNTASLIGIDTAANGASSGWFQIHKPVSGQRVRACATVNYGPFSTLAAMTMNSQQWTTTGSNVVSFKLVHPTASGIDTGSYVSLYKLSPYTSTKPTESIILAASDETSAITTGTAKITFRMPYAFTLTEAPRASLTIAQASGSIFTVDINEGGTSVISTKLTIDNTEKTSFTAATPAVISDGALANDAEITVDVDQVGDGTAKGLKVMLIGYRA